ncbi:MAG: Rid family detoxifying hydrolase [Arcobacter sp.]|nr:Rid family detoxifying hydrolase [Arcobacter sp.]
MKLIENDNLPPAIGPYSQAVKANGMVYTSAQVPLTLDGQTTQKDIKVQTRQVLENLKVLLENSQSSMDSVVKTTIYLANIEDFAVVNVLFAEAFGEHRPARSTVAVKDLPKDFLIMVDATAVSKDYVSNI